MKFKILHKRMLSVLLVLAVLLSGGLIPEAAAEQFDPDRTGVINLRFLDGGEAVTDGSVCAIHVGRIVLKDGVWQYALTENFQNCGMELTDLTRPELPEKLAAYAERHEITGIPGSPDETGLIRFSGLKLGVYLIVQQEAAEGYLPIAPFLVTVPMEKDDQWLYEVDASPKTEISREPEEPTEPTEPELPFTGQVVWPIPLLAICGLLLVMVGWMLYYKKDDQDDEA